MLVGFDSAWTVGNSGALVGVLRKDDGTHGDLGPPRAANFAEAQTKIRQWQTAYNPAPTIILLDQPTIVKNPKGQRPVENIVSSSVSLRYGGVQPANTGRTDMFGDSGPLWAFLSEFGGPADPRRVDLLERRTTTHVIETYPVLVAVALGWTFPAPRATGRLLKYNPERRRTFALDDWKHICQRSAIEMGTFGVPHIERWLKVAEVKTDPSKVDQDGVDACICLLVALHLTTQRQCLMIGEMETGYMVVPYGRVLEDELSVRCRDTDRSATEWVRALGTSP